ncbi:glycosyltransferase WbuB [bacterium]|nr:MAG: glycosyltransferase WbuB [bacterium]
MSSRLRGNAKRALVFAEYFPAYKGSDRRLFHLIDGVQRIGLKVVVTPPLRVLTGRCEDVLKPYIEPFFPPSKTRVVHGFECTYLSLPRFLHRCFRGRVPLQLSYLLALMYLTVQALRIVKREKPDLVVLGHPSYITGVVGAITAKLLRIPILLDYPDAWTPLAMETANLKPGRLSRLLAKIESLVARSADRIVSVTDVLASYIRKLGVTAPIVTIPNGADVKHFSPLEVAEAPRTGHPFRILYAGRLESWAGVDDMVEVVKNVSDRFGDEIRFIFVGDGGAATRFRGDIESRGLMRYCNFAGSQPYKLMPRFIEECDLAILPFPNTVTASLSSPLKLFEYLAMKKPVIATDIAGVREAVSSDHVILIEDITDPRLIDHILDLLRSPERCAAMGNGGRRLVLQYFSWNRLAQGFEREMFLTLGEEYPLAQAALEAGDERREADLYDGAATKSA